MKKTLLLSLFLFACDSFGVFSHKHDSNPYICASRHYNFNTESSPDFDDPSDIDWFECWEDVYTVECADLEVYYIQYYGNAYKSCQDWCNKHDNIIIDEEEESDHYRNGGTTCEIIE